MNQELRRYMEDYREKTLKSIELIEKEDLEPLDDILNSRQGIIDSIENLQYKKEDFINLCEEFKIMQLQKRLTEVMNEKKMQYRIEIDKIKESKNANKSYNKQFSVDSIYFNKKI
ncbi:flagellar protein FliT [Clostridium amazonitimonense]|uniref:flagellar protein FliT n=1 Tax=Clostridium amazonitimonense TaxID=1499689 RepID=UPI000509B818|nr:flagellar protein FliT [Clostridium amazonitimonense]